MNPAPFNTGIEQIPPGRWIVGVSGGADSVALLRLLHDRNDLSLHIAHIDHETRSGESAVDAGFVESLARDLNLPISMARRSEMEAGMPSRSKNRSAHFREVRIAFFKRVVAAQNADGVILAHHADDQAETILHRLIRGSGAASLAGMSARSTVNDLLILRPLLNSRRTALREFLRSIHQEWREDASNRSPEYTRNQLRMILAEQPDLHDSLIELGRACGSLRKWIGAAAPSLKAMFDVDQLASLASPLARRSASRWLAARGSPVEKLSPAVCDQLIQMASDFSTSPCQFFPGGLVVRRKKNVIFLETKDS